MPNFCDVLDNLRGAKLAAYDALLRFGDMGLGSICVRCGKYSQAQIDDAVAWLETAYLAREVTAGIWRLRSIGDAEKQFVAAGHMANARTLTKTQEPETKTFTPANEAPHGRRVHNYQVQMFADV